ncbi:YadA-like family protein [Gallibacterium anatis]|uniref:YadA-like family protein n=1 Tax=Gallibacterium anatis TaxID=750 RepID=UPI000BA1865E|nr:YadA-like family protein [Gallibacterium anatis]WAX70580.1 YadA-like family protein [Gallibacterium anatis]
MNKVYKIIFDPILGLFKVVSELAKGKGKANKGKKLTTLVILTSLSSVAVATDYAAGGGQKRSSVAGSIVIGAGDSNGDAAYVGKDGRDSAGNNGTVVGRTAIGWSTGDTAYGAFSNAKGSSVLNSNFGLADSFDQIYSRSSGEAFHLVTNSNNKLSSNTGGDNVALGFKSSAFGLQSVSLGMKSIASGTNALSVGTRSVARDSYSVAIGSESKGMGEASVAVGTFSNALGNYRLNLNIFNDINSDGHSTITQPEQIYSGGSLKDNSSKYQLMPSTLQTGENGSITMASKIIIEKNSPNKEDAALGVKAIALGDRSASIGVKTVANGTAALALGTESVARTNYTIAQGYQAKAWEEGAIAIGKQAKANAENAIVLGNSSSNQSQNAVVIGNNINLNGSYNDSVVIGNNSTVATNGETRGTSSYTSETIGGLTYGGFTGNPTSVFSIGPAGGRTLQHVAAGQISATSLDAINGSQLYRTNLALGNLATTLVSNLGGNAAVVKANGDTLGQLSFSNIGNTGQDTVHDAIKTIAESTIKLDGDSGSTDQKNRKTNSSFGIKGAASGGITTTASGSDVSISLDKTTKDTLAKVDQMETKVTQLSSGKADTELSNLTNAGKSVITGLVDVKSSSTALTVSSQTDQTSQKKTFNLALNEDGIKELAGTKTLANDISTAKTEAIKDAKSYTDGKLGNTSLTAVNGNNNTAPTTITQAISQITNAVNSGWEIQQGSTKKGDIGAGKKVNFANGDLTTASVVMSADNNTATVKFNVQTTDLDNDKTTGAVSVTEENKNKLVSAENIANAINKATSSLSSSLAFRGDNNPTVGVDVADDTNTKVDLKKQALKVLGTKGQIKTNATSDGLTISLDSTITDTLTNLENSLGNTSLTTTINGNNAAPSSISEAVNQLTTAVNAGWKLKENGNEKGGVGATEAVDFVNGNNTTATVTAKTANKPATVSFSVNTATLTNDNTTGKITTPTTDDANKLVTAGNLATVVNNAVDPNKLATNVKLSYTSTNGTTAATPAKQVSLSDGLNFKSLNNNLTITAKDDGVVEFQAKDWTDEINTAKTQAISDAQSYTDKKLGDTTTLTSVNGITTAPTSITQAINQITSAVNSGWEIQQGGTKKAEIGAGKKVNFADGNLTTASVEMPNNSDVATVKFDVQTTDLTNDDTGVVSVTNENKNKLVSAGDIAKAINKATSSLSSSLAFRGDNNPTVGVDVANDTNTKVDLKKQALKVLGTKGQIKTNATSDGLTISLDSTITDTLTNLEKASSSAAGNITTIQNLLGNTTPTTTINGNTAAPTTISEAVQQLSTAVNTGWKLKENGDERGGVGATEAVDFVNGSNTTAIVTAKTADKPAAVSFNVNTATLANNDSTGKIIAPEKDDADKLVTAGNLATVVNNAVDPSKLAANVKLSYTSTNDTSTATPAKQVSLSKGLNFKSLNNNLTITAKDDGAVEFEAKDWTDDINTAKAKAISDAQSYTDKKLGDTTTLTSVNGITTAPTSITQAINQITSAVNSGWEIQQGSTKKGDIGAGKKVRFTDGNLTTASVEMPNNSDVATVKFDVQTTNLTSNEATGVVSVTDENKNKLVSAENIANAINKATSSLSSSLAFRGDDNANVKVDATGDTNTKVDLKKQALKVLGTSGYVKTAATGQTLTIDLDSDLKGKLNNLPDNVKKSLQDINDKIGTAPPTTENAKTSPTSSDGLNGKSLTEQIHALRDGLAGNVVYTDPDGNRLVKGSNGEYYLAGTPMDENGLPQDTTAQSVDKSTIVATTVNPDGTTTTPTQMGNVKSGLGLDGKGADGTSGSPSEPKAITAKKAKEALNGNSGLLAMEGANSLNKVATVGDLQALAQAGIDFLGNGGDAIHKTLGSTLNIEGKSKGTYNGTSYSADNLITHNDNGTLRIEMLKKPNFEGVQLGSADGKKITLTPNADNGKLTLAKTKADGSPLDNPADNKVVLDGLKAGETADSAVTKGQLDKLASQIGTPVPEDTTGTAGADGLNGKTLAEKVDALRDGTAGNVVYTNQEGKRLVKGSNGEYYLAGTPMDENGLPQDTTAQPVDKSTIVATTVNPDGSTTSPVQMGNVKSGLGLDKTAEPITAKKAKEAIAGADGQSGLLAMKGANNLNKVATVGDLQALAQAGLDFNGNNTKAVVHRPLGTKLEIVGDNPATDFTSAVGNINVFGDPTNNKLVIQLNKVLTNITSIGGGFKDSVTDKTSTNPEDQKAQLTFKDDDLALNNKTLSGVKSAIKPATETQGKTMLDHLKDAAENKGSSVVNVEDLAGVTTALETKLETELTNKGLSFGGDSGDKVSRKLGDQLDVKGGVTDPTKLTDNNIGVVTAPGNNALIVKLAKKISNISSITTETKDGQSATFNSAGMTITGSDDKAGQSASYGLGGTTLTNGKNKAELNPESLTFSDAKNTGGAKSSLSKDSLNFTKKDGSNGISVNGEKGTISNLAERTLVGKDGNGPLSSDYGTGNNRNNAATEGALKDLADKLGVSTPNTLPIDSTTGPSGADGLNGKSVLDKIQALRDGAAGNLVYTDSEGKRLVKGNDGKYYPAGTVFDQNGQPVDKQGQPVEAVPTENLIATTVNPDGSTKNPVQMGNVKSGLGLDETATPITAEAAKNAIAGADGNSGLLTQSGASLNKVATVGDLQALAQAGLDFVGNNEENVHRPLGTQLKVVGDGVDAAKAESFESATGNINVKSNATDNSLTVQLAKDLKNLTSSEFKDAEGNTTTVNGAGITIAPPVKDDGSVAPSVSLSSKGLDNGGNKITNLAKGENDGDAVTIAQLKELTKAVTGSSDINIENKKVNKNNKGLDDGTIFEGEPNGKDVFVEGGKPVLKTYNVSEQKEYLTNSVYTAISNMNEQGIKFFHTNDGKTQQTNQASNTEDSSASGAYSTAIGYQSSAEGENSLAIGSGSVVKGKNSIVIGSEGSVHGSDSISVGTGNEVFGNNSGAFGDPSIINAKSSYLVGNNSTLGAGDDLTKLVEERKALTRPTRPRKLEAKGATESDQDYQNRVNAYLEKMAEYNTALADYMEKREAINEKITALSEKTQGVMAMGNDITVTQGSNGALVMGSNSYVNVVNSGLDTNIQGIAIGNNTRVDTNASSVALGSGAHALQSLEALQAATVYAHEQAIGKGSEVIGEVSFGKEGEYRRLTNVAAGAADTDAVNVSQLKGVASNINQQLNNLSQNISGVAASSAAMANLPQAYLPGKSMVAVSTGYHKGQSAIALGVSRVADNGKLIIKASASHNTQNDFTGGIGVGYQW